MEQDVIRLPANKQGSVTHSLLPVVIGWDVMSVMILHHREKCHSQAVDHGMRCHAKCLVGQKQSIITHFLLVTG